jgi:hypothetical protein
MMRTNRPSSVAILSTTTRANQIALGGASHTLTVAGIANGNAVQSGALRMVTTDAAGNIGTADIPTAGAAFDPTSINNALGALDGRVTALEAMGGGAPFDPTSLNNAVAGLQAGQTTQDNAIAGLQGEQATQANAIAGLQAGQAAQGVAIGALQGVDSAFDARITTLEGMGGGGGGMPFDPTPINNRLDGHDADIAALQGSDTVQNGRLDGHDSAIASLTTQQGATAATVATHTTQIAGLQAGQAVQDARLDAAEAVDTAQTAQIGALQTAQIGALQTVQAATGATVAQHTTQLAQHSTAIGNLQTGMTALQSQMGALQASQTQLFDLVNHDRREARRGIAAAVAMSDAPVPSTPGKTSYVFNLATFRGEAAVGLSLSHRLNVDTPVAITFGFSQAGGKNTAVRVGVAGEF